MKKKIFVDTGFVLALLNTSDEFHSKAIELKHLTHSPNEVITTEAVLLEIGNALSRRHLRQKCSSFINRFYDMANMEVVPVTTQLIKDGLEFFDKRSDKEWGLVDCISFVTMQSRGVKYALAADDHYV